MTITETLCDDANLSFSLNFAFRDSLKNDYLVQWVCTRNNRFHLEHRLVRAAVFQWQVKWLFWVLENEGLPRS